MNIVTSDARHRQRVVRYSYNHGVTQAGIRFRCSRQAIYEWRARYDGNWKSLRERSHRPKSHPKQHSEEEKKLILRHYARNKDDLILLWATVKAKGYTRSYASMTRVLRKWVKTEETRKLKGRKAKPYQRADYPGQKIQIDVKYVPRHCVVNWRQYYQFTAVDECSRHVYREMYEELSTYSAKDFLIKLVTRSPFPIRLAQTDNGREFTNALLVKDSNHKTLFEEALEDMGILYQRIRVATPRHNGKVERQHRCDEKRFYSKLRMYSLEDGRTQLATYNKKSNKIPKVCLNFLSPNQVLEKYLGVM